MNKTCPSCKREIAESEQFCPFCAAFVGEEKENSGSKSRIKTIIGCAAGVAAIGTAAALIFALDVFGLFGEKINEAMPGTGDRLFERSVTPVCVNDKWGYINSDGATVIAPQYSAAYSFNADINDTAPAAQDGRFGYIDIDGEFIVMPSYSFAGAFSDTGLARIIDSNGKSAYVDSRGRTAFGERSFDYASDFTGGYAFAYTLTAQTGGTDSASGYSLICSLLSSDGTVTDLPEGQGIEYITGDNYIGTITDNQAKAENSTAFTKRYAVFSCGSKQALTDYCDRIIPSGKLLIMCNGTNEDGLYKATLISADTLQSLPGEYLCPVDTESCGKGAVLLKKDNGTIKQVLITDSGKEAYTAEKGAAIISGFDSSGYACIYENGRYIGLSEDKSRFEADCQFGSFNCGLAPFFENGKIGYINTAGEKIIEARYDGASEYYADGYAYVKNGTEYSIIDMSGNITADGLSQSPGKLLFSNSVHKWYDLSDFEEYCGEPMYNGNICVTESTGYYDAAQGSYTTSLLITDKNGNTLSKNHSVLANGMLDNGYFLVSELSSAKNYLAFSDGTIAKDACFDNASAAEIGSSAVIRHSGENTVRFSDLYGNTLSISGTQAFDTAQNYTAVNPDFEFSTHQAIIYDDKLQPVLSISCNPDTGASQHGGFIYIQKYKSQEFNDNKSSFIAADRVSGKVFLSSEYYELEPLGDHFYEQFGTVWTAYGKELGSFVYSKAYGDRMLCFDYDKYRIFDRYGQLIGEYDYRPKISEENGSMVLKNGDGTFSLYDRYLGLILTTQYDIQPFANGYIPFADMQAGKLGFLDMNGNICISPAYDYISAVTPDGYFASKVRESNESGDTVYYDSFATVYINSITGESTKCVWGTQDAYAVKNRGYSLLDFYTADKIYRGEEAFIKLSDELLISYVSDKGGYCFRDFYGNIHFDEYPCNSGYIDELPLSISMLYDGTIAVGVPYIAGGSDIPKIYYLKIDGTPIKKGDTSLYIIDGFPTGDYGDNGIIIYTPDGTKLFAENNIKPETDYYYLSISMTGHYIIIDNSDGSSVFDIETGEKVLSTESYITPVYESFVQYHDGSSWHFVNLSTGEEKLLGYSSYVRQICEGLALYDDGGLWHLVNLDTGKEYTSTEYPNVYMDNAISVAQIDYPIICTCLNQSGITNKAEVYAIDSDMNAEYVCSYYCNDDEVMQLEYDNRILLKRRFHSETSLVTFTLINVKSGKQLVFENASDITVGEDCITVTVKDDSSADNRIYNVSADLETITEE